MPEFIFHAQLNGFRYYYVTLKFQFNISHFLHTDRYLYI